MRPRPIVVACCRPCLRFNRVCVSCIAHIRAAFLVRPWLTDRGRRLVGQLLTWALIMGSVIMIILETAGPAIVRLMGATPYNEDEVSGVILGRLSVSRFIGFCRLSGSSR